jgi:hypothetical protein
MLHRWNFGAVQMWRQTEFLFIGRTLITVAVCYRSPNSADQAPSVKCWLCNAGQQVFRLGHFYRIFPFLKLPKLSIVFATFPPPGSNALSGRALRQVSRNYACKWRGQCICMWGKSAKVSVQACSPLLGTPVRWLGAIKTDRLSFACTEFRQPLPPYLAFPSKLFDVQVMS